MFVTVRKYPDAMTKQYIHRYDLFNDDGTYHGHITSRVELNLMEIMLKTNESEIWFIEEMPFGQTMNIQWLVNKVSELNNTK